MGEIPTHYNVFQLPSWDTGIYLKVVACYRDRFQLPSWDTLILPGSVVPDVILSTPFLGYGPSSTGGWSDDGFQLPSWDTGRMRPITTSSLRNFQLPSWDTGNQEFVAGRIVISFNSLLGIRS